MQRTSGTGSCASLVRVMSDLLSQAREPQGREEPSKWPRSPTARIGRPLGRAPTLRGASDPPCRYGRPRQDLYLFIRPFRRQSPRISAPEVLGRTACDGLEGLVCLPNGEVRHYDYGIVDLDIWKYPDHFPRNYIRSRDGGLTWQKRAVPRGCLGADARSPLSGEFLRLLEE